MKKLLPYLIIFLGVFILFVPIIINPNLFLGRDNDLNEFFWPIYYFAKDQIINHHVFPLWNNLFLSGTPLLPDPQSPLFYLPNVIFLFFSIDVSFVVSSFIHIFAGGVGMYLASKKGFCFSEKASLIAALIYVFTPRLSGYLIAGHIGLINSWAWVPYVMLSILMIVKRKEVKWSILLAISMAALFFTHTFNFLIISITSAVFLYFANKLLNKKGNIKPLIIFGTGAIITFGLTAVTLIPQFVWQGITNRTLLLTKPQIFPMWASKLEFVKAVITPWLIEEGIQNINTEKWIASGLFASLVCIFGLLKLKRKILVPLFLFSFMVLLISLGNASPVYTLLFRMDWYRSMRIPPRVWVVFLVSIPILVAFALDKYKSKLITLLSVAIIVETLFFSWVHITKPVVERATVPEEIYSVLAEDKDLFRVICLHRCISQKEAATRHLELIDGYSTLTQLNYYKISLQLTGGYWDYYALPTPPTGVYIFQDLQPSADALGAYNTKYVLSDHELNSPKFSLVNKIESIYLYKIVTFVPRNYEVYSPNYIRVHPSEIDHATLSLTIPEIYSLGWKAYLNGKDEAPILETPISLRAVNIRPETGFVDFKYFPPGYKLGKEITSATLLSLLIYFLYVKTRKRK